MPIWPAGSELMLSNALDMPAHRLYESGPCGGAMQFQNREFGTPAASSAESHSGCAVLLSLISMTAYGNWTCGVTYKD